MRQFLRGEYFVCLSLCNLQKALAKYGILDYRQPFLLDKICIVVHG